MNWRVLQGISQAALEDRAHQEQVDAAKREQARQTRGQFENFLTTVANHPQMPDAAKTTAMHGLLDTITRGDKIDDKHYGKWADALWRSTLRPAPQTQGEQVTSNLNQAAPGMGAALDVLAPGAGTAFSATSDAQAARIPTSTDRPQIGGMLTADEVQQRVDDAERHRLSIQHEIMPPPPKFMNVPADSRMIDTRTGRVVTEGRPRTDTNRTELDIVTDPKSTPQAREIAWKVLRLKNPGPREPQIRYGRQVFARPDGTLVEVMTNPVDPNEPPTVRPLPTGLVPTGGPGGGRGRNIMDMADYLERKAVDLEASAARSKYPETAKADRLTAQSFRQQAKDLRSQSRPQNRIPGGLLGGGGMVPRLPLTPAPTKPASDPAGLFQ